MSAPLTFTPDDHSYWLEGRRLPGVTETISRLAPHRDVGDWYLQRGAAVHAAVALALQDELDPDSVDERIAGRIEAVMKFIRDTGLVVGFFETPFASRRHQFAGTLDYFGTAPDGKRVLADWKGSLCPQVEPQIGAYNILLEENGHTCDRAVAVETHDDGSYKCRWFDKREIRLASQTFLAFLTTRNWLEANKFKAPKL